MFELKLFLEIKSGAHFSYRIANTFEGAGKFLASCILTLLKFRPEVLPYSLPKNTLVRISGPFRSFKK